MKRITQPVGWGVGVPLIAYAGGPYDDVEKRITTAMRELQPAWWQTWSADVPEALRGAGWMPALESGIVSADAAQACDGRTALILNEPETYRQAYRELADPARAATRTCEAVEALRRLKARFNWVAPNCNVNGTNLEWLAEYAAELVTQGYLPWAWGVHLYSPQVSWAEEHWQRFMRWRQEHGEGRPVVLTECGAGANASVAQHIAMIRYLRTKLATEVAGAAYFAAHQYRDGQRRYLGLCEVTALRDEWRRT